MEVGSWDELGSIYSYGFYMDIYDWFEVDPNNLLVYLFDQYSGGFLIFCDITDNYTRHVWFNRYTNQKAQVANLGKESDLDLIHPCRF